MQLERQMEAPGMPQAQGLYDDITKDVKVTEDDAKKQYEKDKQALYTTARSRKVAHILLDIAPTYEKPMKNRARNGIET